MKTIPLTRPYMGAEEKRLISEVVDSGWLTQGPAVTEFEKKVAAYVGVRHAVAASSCTTALAVALECLGVGPGDEVIVPSYSFIATANVIQHRGARPVFVDINLDTYNIDEEKIEEAITPRTRLIMPVHQVGLPAHMTRINRIARDHGVMVIEDAACAIGSEYEGRKIGTHTRCACFSFHPRKVITTGEGGMIVTDDDELADRARSLISHGASVDEEAKHKAEGLVIVHYPDFGYNYRLSNIQGAMGVAQMDRIDWLLERRRSLAAVYDRAFGDHPRLVIPHVPEYARPTYQSYMLRIRDADAEERNRILSRLKSLGVQCTPGICAIHKEPCYAQEYGQVCLPCTEKAFDTTMIIPLYPHMSEDDQSYVIEQVLSVL
ncbi:MAG: DegT/DnrJ/EryC1/StrS family aminotransferase [Deltaproteobacteria bacterium]|nr:DegT/DnrJ/EryC1/StrS family aminotransferase [Deltaproteobacteria bacterium]